VGNQLMDGVADSAERAVVNALAAELGHLVHAADTKTARLTRRACPPPYTTRP